ncbi:hypothetical protein M433DRAFT_205841 [Acidomyces richmondensis BFW]|nr:MAG: hypothetical protein FE78DRAFT_373834 [Acidomyces sp. 'richmondensis']KYG49993.1 hypothetical protein M433DRAFT_205841 [Acidomyces richmondensis BFW]
MFLKGLLCLSSLVAGSFAQSLETLILTQGIMYGFGFILLYYRSLAWSTNFESQEGAWLMDSCAVHLESLGQ